MAGVEIPAWIRVFDCRAPDVDIAPRAPWGPCLWGSERAAVDLGLRGQGFQHDTTPMSCSGTGDLRKASDAEIARHLTNAFQEADKLRALWEKARTCKRGNQGGSCFYQPVAVTISNYGWGVMCDERTMAVQYFGV